MVNLFTKREYMRIPIFFMNNQSFDPDRSIYSTNPGEVRYFVIDGEDTERKIRVTGTEDGGLRVEQLIGDTWQINTTALPRLGDGVVEVASL